MDLTMFGAMLKRLKRQKSSAELKKFIVPRPQIIQVKKERQLFSKKLQKKQDVSIQSANSLSQM